MIVLADPQNDEIIITATVATIQTEGMIEVGKEMMKKSIEVGRDYCKFMITTSFSAIPIYLGLLKLVIPEDANITNNVLIFLFVGPTLFIVSALIFIGGYLPKVESLSLDDPRSIADAHSGIIKTRVNIIIAGTIVFIIACIVSIIRVALYLYD